MSSEDAYWRTRPGGLSSVAFTFPTEPRSEKQTGYYNLDFFIAVTKDPGNALDQYPIPQDVKGPDSVLGYYWANQFAFMGGRDNGVDGYIGIQTVGNISTFDPANPNAPDPSRSVKKTKIAIFSIWDALDGRPGPANSYCAPFCHEGSGWSCRVEYPWREGVKYCLRIWELLDAEKPNEPEWWRGAIIDTATNQEAIIGDIRVPAEWSWLRKDASCFTECYSSIVKQEIGDEDHDKPNPRVCQYMPKAEVLIYPPQANNRSVVASTMTPQSYGKCAGVSAFARLQDGATILSGTRLTPAEPLVNRTGRIEIAR